MGNTFFEWLNSTHIAFQSVELAKAFIVFLMFSVIGWMCEVAYVGIFFEHKFVNRGMLHGPLCPIYGVGGILILELPPRLQNPVWLLFITGLIFCSLVEYMGSFALEKIFHTKWWDYSDKKLVVKGKTILLNINGRICLQNSLLFGVMTVVVIKFVQPLIEKVLSYFSDIALITIANVLLAVFLVDLVITITKLVDFNVHIARLKEFGESLRDHYQSENWFKGDTIETMLESIKAHAAENREKFSEKLLEKVEYAEKRNWLAESFMRHFPTMKSSLYKDSLAHVRNQLSIIDRNNKKQK